MFGTCSAPANILAAPEGYSCSTDLFVVKNRPTLVGLSGLLAVPSPELLVSISEIGQTH